MESIANDVKFALRSLLRRPVFASVAVATLGTIADKNSG
jgi:hypothetical protein